MVHKRKTKKKKTKKYPILFKVSNFVMKSQKHGSNIMEQFWKWPRAWLQTLVIGPTSRCRWWLEWKSEETVQDWVYRVQDGLKSGVTRWAPFMTEYPISNHKSRAVPSLGDQALAFARRSNPLTHHSSTHTHQGIAQEQNEMTRVNH